MEDNLIQECIALYNEGETMIGISRIIGKNKKTIKKAIKDFVIIKRFHNVPSNEEIEESIKLYENGEELEKISEIMNIKYSTLYKHIREKIKIRKRLGKTKVPREELIQMYLEGNSCDKIAEKFNYCSGKKINKILKSSGIARRSISEATRDMNIKHSFFKTMGNEQCYWAGFLAADGCVRRAGGGYIIALGLSIVDLNHIEKYKEVLNIKGKTIFRKAIENKIGLIKRSNRSVYVAFGSKEIFYDLCNVFNFTIRKSLTLEPPSGIPNKFVSHFIRGYLDGDGWIVNNIKSKAIGFIGTKNFLEWIKSMIKANCSGVGNPSVRQEGKVYKLQFGGNKQVPKILKWLYGDVDEKILLDRKYKIYLAYEESLLK